MAMPWTISSSSCDNDAAAILSAVAAATVESAGGRIFDPHSPIGNVEEDVFFFYFFSLGLEIGPLFFLEKTVLPSTIRKVLPHYDEKF
jgi:hypothetical protein